ncbi:MAG TPA: hypothetical protein VNZ26_25820, partial [Vicinamibacterales bacterium]|nr:hypothetical protein [Vicinamibacterales bacterium]
FYVKIPFTEDKFADALELRPSNMAVVHHAGAYVVDIPEGVTIGEDGRAFDSKGKELGPEELRKLSKPNTDVFEAPLAGSTKLISYVPGRGAEDHPEGFGKRLPAGKYIYFVQHYNPIGKIAQDQTRLGVWFAKKPVMHEVLNLQAGDPVPGPGAKGKGLYFSEGKEIVYNSDDTTGRRGAMPTIPPYNEAFKMVGVTPVTEPITLYGLTPHMHLRGKSLKWIVTWPDGTETTVLDVPKYDFNWQIDYELAEPLKIPAGSKVTAIAYYDNSVKNKWNPAPEKEVYWSEQSWDEMFQPTTQFSVDSQDLSKKQVKVTTQQNER